MKKIFKKHTFLPTVSVIIPALNEEKMLAKTLRSLKKQTYRGEVEIIVVDNNSTDKTAEVAKNFNVRIIYEPIRGVAHCRQTGFLKASGDILVSTDADTIVPKNWLEYFVNQFHTRPKAVAVSGMYSFYDGSLALRFLTAAFNYPLFCALRWHSGANMAVKRDAFLAVGGFNKAISISEDSDLCLRLRKVGKVYRLPFFKVQTSARRFNQLGLLGGIWDYSYTYFKSKTGYGKGNISFRSASEIKPLNWKTKLAINMTSLLVILAIVGVSEVRAEVMGKQRKHLHLSQAHKTLHRNTHQVARLQKTR